MKHGGCAYAAAGVLMFFGVALACNFAGDPQRWKTGVVMLAVCAVPLIVLAGRAVRRRLALGPVEWKIENGRAIYIRPVRRGEVRAVEAQLLCEAVAKIRWKWQEIWIPRTLYRKQLEAHATRVGERLEIQIPFAIEPQIAGGTWRLSVMLRMRGAPDDVSSYRLSAS